MKKTILFFSFLFCVSQVFSQRREVRMQRPDTIIHKSLFTEGQLTKFYDEPPKEGFFPYMRIFLFQNGVRDTVILQYYKPYIESDKIKQGFLPVFIR